MSTAVDVDRAGLAVLSRVLAPERLPTEVAQYILGLSFEDRDRDRMIALADKARWGVLTDEERLEVEAYSQAGHLLTWLQSKARMAIQRHDSGSR
jgi:hypothetical protein